MKPFDPRLLRAAPELRRPVAALTVVAALQGVAAIALAFALARLVVDVVSGGVWQRSGVWVVGAFIARAALAALVDRVAASASHRVSAGLRRRLLAHWLAAPVEARPEPERASTLAVQGASAVEPYAARFLPALVAGVVVPVLSVGALVLVDPLSALVVVLTLPLLPLFAALIGRETQDDTRSRWRALEQLAGHFGDVMRGLPTLVSYGRARRQVEVVGAVSEQHRTATMRTLRVAFLSSSALELLASISVAIVAVTVGLRLTHGSMTLHAGLLAILLAPEAYWPIRRVGAEFHAAADGATAVDAILTALTPPTSCAAGTGERQRARPSSARSRVVVEGVGYAFPGSERLVLDSVSLDAGPGLTVVTGPSGAGKSTLLDLVAGLRTPTAGRVLRGGAFHYVTQRPFLPDGSIAEAMRLGSSTPPPDPELWSVLHRVGLGTFVAGLPDRLDTPLGDDGFGLSAGQRTRLALARALLSPAPVVLLDEPTAHLDAPSAAIVRDVVRELARERCVVAATHSADLVTVADDHVHLTGSALEAVPA